MKKSIIIVFYLILFSQVGFCQLMPDFTGRIDIKLAYGKWYRVDGVWADTRDRIRPDLEIFKNDSVIIKQTMYVNPCRYEFVGKLLGSNIRHISKLYCVDREAQEMPLVRMDTASYEIVYLSENHLTLSGRGFTMSFQKEVEFSNIFRVLTLRKWATPALGYYPQQLNLECHAEWQAKSNSVFWTWEFFRNGKLIISDGIVNDSLKWTLRTDSVLNITSNTKPHKNKEFKLFKIAPCDMEIKELIHSSCKEDILEKFVGNYLNNEDSLNEGVELRLMDNYYFQLSYAKWKEGETNQMIGLWELDENNLILHPQEAAVLRINTLTTRPGINLYEKWQFVRDIDMTIPYKQKKNKIRFEFPLQNGEMTVLSKISSPK